MKTLLVVDDNKAIRDLLSLAFSGIIEGCTVRTAENGAEAVEILKSVPVSAIITDLSMPVMDGYQLIEWVRARYPKIPVIVMSGEACADVFGQLRPHGIVRCFEKPFNIHDAAQTVASVLRSAESFLTLMPVPA